MSLFKPLLVFLLSAALVINPVAAEAGEAALVSLANSGVNGLISGNFDAGQAAENAAIAALTAALSSGVGDLKLAAGINPGNLLDGTLNPVATLESALLHGAVGCVGSSLSGQSCGSGFVSGAVSDLANVVSTGNTASDLLLHAVIGGTASQLSGGDFATGALNASLAEMFNYLSHPQAQQLQTANQALAGCQLSGTCDAQTVAKLQAQVNQLESLDATTNANLSLDCANGASVACFNALVDVQKANATYNPLGSYFDGTDSQLAANLRAENASASGLGGFLLSFAASLTLHPEILLALPASTPEAALGEAGGISLNFSQKTASPLFSLDGNFNGVAISDIASQLRSGALSPADVPIQIIDFGQGPLIVNTRSSLALTQAGIPQSQWVIQDVSNSSVAVENILQRLTNNNLSLTGTNTLRITGSGSNASTYIGKGNIP